MAKPGEASIVITLIDKASAGLKGLSGSIDVLKRNWLAVAAAVSAVTAFIADSVKAFAEQESAVSKLNVALKNQGVVGNAASKSMQEYAEALQKTTAFSDEAIIEGQALLTTFGLLGQANKDATKAALDLSVGLGMDLHSAMMLVGKASQGNTAMLGRYGIKISDTLPPAQKFAAALGEINARFGGAAQAQAGTFTGRIEMLKNAFNDFQEKIGKEAMPVLEKWLEWGNKAVAVMNNLLGSSRADMSVREAAISQEKAYLAIAQKRLTLFEAGQREYGVTREALQKEIVSRTNIINKLKEQEAAEKSLADKQVARSTGRKVELDDESKKFIEAKQAEVDALLMTEDTKILLQAEKDAQKLEALGQHKLAVDLLETASAEAGAIRTERENADKKKALDDRMQATRTTLTALASFQNSKNKEMAAVGKASASAMALMDTISASASARKALSGIPVVGPALGMAAAAAIMAAGLANVAQINGVQLAHGGVVLPRSGGTQATIGEAGRAEAVIPLGTPQARQMLGGGGGGTNITIQAGVIVADKTSVAEFAGMIEEELFRRSRAGKSLLDIT